MAEFDNRLDREDGIRTMDALDKLQRTQLDDNTKTEQLFKYLMWGYIKYDDDEGLNEESFTMLKQAAADYAALRERAEKAEAERDALKEFANNILETMELHSSHWEYHLRRNLRELEAALKGAA